MIRNTDSDLSPLLPDSLRGDPVISGLAAAFSAQYRRIVMDIPAVMPWERLDSLAEPMLSLLAYEVNPLLWDDEWEDAVKRDVLRNSLRWRMIHGTPACVEEFLQVVTAMAARVVPWWEYGGRPGCFRLSVIQAGENLSCPRLRQTLEMIARAKNTRSHFDGFYLAGGGGGTVYIAGACRMHLRIRLSPHQEDVGV
jgi:phage tail P2-like protein